MVSNKAQRHHAEYQHDQGRDAFVNEHLVDDQLEKDRRRQSEQLHKQRRDHHMGERAPVAQDRGARTNGTRMWLDRSPPLRTGA